MTLSGDGTITGLAAGGLPNATVTADDLAAGAALNSVSDGVFFRNRIINGDMRIAQRATTGTAQQTGSFFYNTVDRWVTYFYGVGVATQTQDSDAPTGFSSSTKFEVTTIDSSIAGADDYIFGQKIEGFNTSDLAFGTANAKTITLSFWVKCSATGTLPVALQNSAASRSYVSTVTINSADTWEYKTITVAGDTTGTWIGATNGIGLSVYFNLGNSKTVTANTWSGGNYLGVSGATNFMATLNLTIQFTGVQLEVGTVATPFERRPYGTELALCQRYYYKHSTGAGPVVASISCYSSTRIDCAVKLPVTMRSSPTLDVASGSNYFQAYAGSYAQQFSTMLLNTAQPNSVLLYNNAVSGFTEGRAGWLETINASAYLAFSAEL